MEKFRHGDKVVVIDGEMKGSIGYISYEYFLPEEQGGIKYSLEPEKNEYSANNPFKNSRFASKELTLITPRTEPKVEFDFTKYIDESKMKEIAERVYEKEVTEFVDQVLRNRIDGYGTITDQILQACSKRYVDKLAPKFEEDFFKKCQEEIHRETDPDGENYYPFRQGLKQNLNTVAGKYIDENIDVITKIIKPKIEEAIDLLTKDTIASAIGWKLNNKMKEILLDVLKEAEEKKKEKA